MNLKAAFEHLVKRGWNPPNRVFITRFKHGEISDNRLRSILKTNGYYCISEEKWSKNKRNRTS